MLVTSLVLYGGSLTACSMFSINIFRDLHVTKAQSGLLVGGLFWRLLLVVCPPLPADKRGYKADPGRLVPVCAWRAAVCADGGERDACAVPVRAVCDCLD